MGATKGVTIVVLPGRGEARVSRIVGYSERAARAYNGGLGAERPGGSRGKAPGQGVMEASPF